MFWGRHPISPFPTHTGMLIYDCIEQLCANVSVYRPHRYHLLQIILTTPPASGLVEIIDFTLIIEMARRERTISGTEIVKADLGGADRSIDTNTPDLDIIWRLVNGANAGKVRF